MNNIEKYKKAFQTALDVDESKIHNELKYQEIEEWDSIAHMSLISEIEECFGITFQTDDIVDLSSFKKGIEILKKYKVNI